MPSRQVADSVQQRVLEREERGSGAARGADLLVHLAPIEAAVQLQSNGHVLASTPNMVLGYCPP